MTNKSYHHGDLRRALIKQAALVIDTQGIEALTLRGLARDLGVSHGAPNRHFRNKGELLAALATEAYHQVNLATQKAAEASDSEGHGPVRRLNAMGRGFLRWALDNRALFNAINHPDIKRSADDALLASMRAFQLAAREATMAAQKAGRYPEKDPRILALFTNSVPFGAAQLIDHEVFAAEIDHLSREQLIVELMDYVVPILDEP